MLHSMNKKKNKLSIRHNNDEIRKKRNYWPLAAKTIQPNTIKNEQINISVKIWNWISKIDSLADFNLQLCMPIREVLELSVFLLDISMVRLCVWACICRGKLRKIGGQRCEQTFGLSTKIASRDDRKKHTQKIHSRARHNGKTNRTHY